jgi:hypothetical protein
MGFQADLMTALFADSGLAAVVSDRIYPNDAPSDAATPFIVWYEFATPREQALDTTIAVSKPRIQWSIYADTYADALAVGDALRAAFQATSFMVIYEDERGNQEVTTGLHRRDIDTRITHVGT